MTHEKSPAVAPGQIDWGQVARTAFGSALFAGLVGGAVQVLAKVIEAEMKAAAVRNASAQAPAKPVQPIEFDLSSDEDLALDDSEEDSEAIEAAALLGVKVDASEDAIRSALRATLTYSRLHPDQGGDIEEAKRIIAAKNLLIARARSVQP